MSKLKALLEELESRWHSRGFTAESQGFCEGLPEREVRDALASHNLPAPEEIIEWYSWKNGYTPGRTPSLTPSLLVPISLGDALNSNQIWRRDEWAKNWIPLDHEGGWGLDLAADPVRVEVHGHDVSDPAWSREVRAPSLAAIIDAWLEVLDGDCPLTPEGFAPHDIELPPELAYRALM